MKRPSCDLLLESSLFKEHIKFTGQNKQQEKSSWISFWLLGVPMYRNKPKWPHFVQNHMSDNKVSPWLSHSALDSTVDNDQDPPQKSTTSESTPPPLPSPGPQLSFTGQPQISIKLHTYSHAEASTYTEPQMCQINTMSSRLIIHHIEHRLSQLLLPSSPNKV